MGQLLALIDCFASLKVGLRNIFSHFLKTPFKTQFKKKKQAADQTTREVDKGLGEGHPERFPSFVL